MARMHHFKSLILLSGTAASLALLAASPSVAGFKWIAPVEPVPQIAPAVPAAPAPVQGGVVAAPLESVDALEISQPGQDFGSDVLEGFGSDVSLAIALQQIAPVGYQFSFGTGVNPGVVVSWQGGKPWRAVLSETLSPYGMDFYVRDNVITVVTSGARAPAQRVAVQQKAPATEMSDLPLDMIDSSLGGYAQVKKEEPEPVTIRRLKPGLLLDRLDETTHQAAVENQAPLAPSPSAPMNIATAQSSVALQPAEQKVSTQTVLQSVSTPPAATPSWKADAGMTLRDALTQWSDQAGIEIYWAIDYDYRLRHPVAFGGSYEQAAAELIASFAHARPQPFARLHNDRDGRRVLVVRSYDIHN